MISADFLAYLLAQASITALVGQRISPEAASAATQAPYVTYAIESEEHEYDLAGESGWVTVSITLDVWAATYGTTRDVSLALRGALKGYTGAMGATAVRAVIVDSETDAEYLPASSASDAGTYHAGLALRLFY